MASTKAAILQMKINNVLTELIVKTNFDSVFDAEGKTLTAKVEEMFAAINALPTTEAVNTAIKEADDALYNKILGKVDDQTTINEAYDTLKEVYEWIEEHGDVATALRNDITDLQTRMGTAEGEIDALQTAVGELETAVENVHTHDNKTVLDGITAADVTEWNSKSTVVVVEAGGTVDESTLAENDLVVQLVD